MGRGKPGSYSDVAIQTCLTLKTLFRLPYRATEGLVKSLMRLGALDLPVPDHTHLSRRAATLEVKIPRRPRTGATHVVVDATGLKIFGEGEWKVRQHGVGKRRTWRKIHLAVDETAKDIIGIEVTTADWHDSEVFPDLLAQVEGEVSQVSGDGAYDTAGTHAAIAGRDARATIPPRHDAVPWGNNHPRDVILAGIAAISLTHIIVLMTFLYVIKKMMSIMLFVYTFPTKEHGFDTRHHRRSEPEATRSLGLR